MTVGVNPNDIVVAPDGTVYISNSGSKSVTVLNPQGAQVHIPVGTQIYQQVGVTAGGGLILTSLVDGSTKIINKSPNQLGNYGTASFDAIASGIDIALAPDGTIYVDRQTYFGWGGSVYGYRPDGTLVGYGTTYGGLFLNGDTSPSASDMAVGPDGKIYVVSNRLYVGEPTGVDSSGYISYTFTSPAFDVTDLGKLAVGYDGRIYVTQGNNVVVYSGLDYSTLAIITRDVPAFTYLRTDNIISGPDGKIYVSASGYYGNGQFGTELTVINPNDYSTQSKLLNLVIKSVAASADGRIFAVGDDAGIAVLNADLSLESTISVGGQGFRQILLGSDGNLYAIGDHRP